MKRLIVFLLFVCAIVNLGLIQNDCLHEMLMPYGENFYIYQNNCDSYFNGGEIIKNGSGQIVKLNKNEIQNNLNNIKNYAGESVVVNNISLKKIIKILNLNVLKKYYINNDLVVIGYSNKLNHYLISENKKVNIQIKVGQENIIVGYPLIMEGF